MTIHPVRADSPPIDTSNILGVEVARLPTGAAIDLLRRRLADRHFTKVGFLNAHNANMAVVDARLAAVFADFLVLPDGVGVDLAASLLYRRPFPANLNGTDFTPHFLAAVAEPLTVALLGARREIVERAAGRLAELAPQHRIEVVGDGFFAAAEEPAILDRLAALRPEILLVAMGVPRQEFFIADKLGPAHCTMPIAVGALFDFLSGAKPRAPWLMRRLRLEWLFRLAIEPGRLWRRYIIGNPLFLYRVVRQRLTQSRDGR